MKRIYHLFVFAFILMMLTGCQVIGGIFKAGVWVGVLTVVIIIVLVVWIVLKMIGGRRD